MISVVAAGSHVRTPAIQCQQCDILISVHFIGVGESKCLSVK